MMNVILLLAFGLTLQEPSAGKDHQKPTEKKNSSATQLPTARTESPSIINNLKAAPEQNQPQQQTRWWKPPALWDIYWPTLALVIATGITICYAARTLGAIRDQVDEMKKALTVQIQLGGETEKLVQEASKQSIAATKSADALINSERAWIDGDLQRGLPENEPIWNDLSECKYSLNISNFGRTPAHVIGWELGIEALPLAFRNFEPKTLKHRINKELNLFLTAQQGPIEVHDFDMAQDVEDWGVILGGGKTGVIEVLIRYMDILSGKPHETYFVYSYKVSEARFVRLHWRNKYS